MLTYQIIHQFLTDDVIGVAYVDLEKLDIESLANTLAGDESDSSDDMDAFRRGTGQINAMVENFRGHGISRLYILMRFSDVQDGGTSMVIPVDEEKRAGKSNEELIELAKQISEAVGDPISKPFQSF